MKPRTRDPPSLALEPGHGYDGDGVEVRVEVVVREHDRRASIPTLLAADPRFEIERDFRAYRWAQLLGRIFSGKMREHCTRVLEGDRVKVEVSPYDLSRGRVTYRYE